MATQTPTKTKPAFRDIAANALGISNTDAKAVGEAASQSGRYFEAWKGGDDKFHWHAKDRKNGEITFQGQGHSQRSKVTRAIQQELEALGSNQVAEIRFLKTAAPTAKAPEVLKLTPVSAKVVDKVSVVARATAVAAKPTAVHKQAKAAVVLQAKKTVAASAKSAVAAPAKKKK